MANRMEELRQGNPIEIEPGKYARLDPKTKTLQFSTGERRSVANDPEFFPQNEGQLEQARAIEREEANVPKYPFGEFGYQAAQSGIIGGGQDWINRFTAKSNEEYARKKNAQAGVSERISEESPIKSGLAYGASIGADLLLTRGMSGLSAGAAIPALSAGSRILDEPGQVAIESGLGGIAGKAIEMGGQYLGKIAARRGQSRQIPQQAQAVREANATGQAATDLSNQQAAQQYNVLKQSVKSQNEAELQRYKVDLNDRKQAIIAGKNAETQAVAARDAEIFQKQAELRTARAIRSSEANRLEQELQINMQNHNAEVNRIKSENKIAETQYEKALKELPTVQAKAQKEYSDNVVRNAQSLEKIFSKDARVISDEFQVGTFIEDQIEKSGLAGSREATQSSKILRSLFPEGEILTGKELSKRYRALEDVIQKSSPEVQQVLSQFKEHLSTRVPKILADNIAYKKIMPTLQKSLAKSIDTYLAEIPGKSVQKNLLGKSLHNNLAQAVRELSPADFVQKMQSGEIAAYLESRIANEVDFLQATRQFAGTNLKDIQKLNSQNFLKNSQNEIAAEMNFIVGNLKSDIEKQLSKAEIKVINAQSQAEKKLGSGLKSTLGIAEPVPIPQAPIRQEFPQAPIASAAPPPNAIGAPLPPPVAPFVEPPLPGAPQLAPLPTAPIQQNFVPGIEPTLPAASNIAERLGDTLEQPLGKNFLKSKGALNNPLAKLYLLKQVLGGAAAPVELATAAGYGALKGLTAPGAGAARASFKQAGIAAIDMLAQKYPSYHGGILDNPQERRSLTKEIEEDPEIPGEQKAILQSKVNRGKPILGRLE